ncbi:MAG TPA: type VI immunity family protein [Vicinamibacterales bacterium]|jgi:hypothetical protein
MSATGYRWLSDFLPVGEEGQPLLDVGFYVTLFFEDGHLIERRRAAYEILKEYWFLVGEHLRWTTNPETHGWEQITAQHSTDAWLAAQPKEPCKWAVILHGGETFDAASPYRVEGLGTPDPRRAMSFITAMFPVTWFADHPEASAVDIVQRWATLLRPRHGTAGLSIVASLDRRSASRTKERARELAERLPGLEVDDAVSESIYVQNGIRSVNWLTCIDDALVARLGGIEALRGRVAGDLHLLEYPGGAIIQAGDFPQAGDRNRQRSIEPYRRAAALLRPVQPTYTGIMLGFDEESTQDWVNRFS